jgi:hypothetical protein
MQRGIKRTNDIEAARQMRAKGFTLPEIGEALGASKSSVHGWVKDVVIPKAGQKRLARLNRERYGRMNLIRNAAWVATMREQREAWRQEGRDQAIKGDPQHAFACALYWGEGAKSKNMLKMCNSDISIMDTFVKFLKKYFDVKNEDFMVKLIAYTDCVPRSETERYWEEGLNIHGATFGPHEFDTRKYVTRGAIRLRTRRIKYGTCYLNVRRSTRILQHIYGALEVYGGAMLDHHGNHPALITGDQAIALGLV